MSGYTQTELEEVHSHLDRLVASPVFAHAERMVRFLRYVVDEVLADRGERLNQTALGIEVFDRNENFDPAVDSLVRVEAGRLRAKLREYYEAEGKGDTVRFELPKGTYQVTIHIDPAVRSISSPSQSELNSGSAQSTVKTSTDTTQTSPGKFSIAVLPFEVLTHDPNDEEIADAITTEIIDELGQAASFEVVSRRSAFNYKGRSIDARSVGRELDVRYVLEGSLRRAASRLRIGVALIDAINGRQMWSKTYNREMADPFELQDDIGHAVAAVLSGVLWRAAMEAAQRLPREQLDASSRAHLGANMFFNFSRRTIEAGEQLARREIEQDPELGHGYMHLSFLLAFKVVCCWTDNPAEACAEVLAAANSAVKLAPNDSWVLALTAEALIWIGEANWALTLAERALALEPDNLVNRARLGDVLVHVGRTEEGLTHIESAIALGPEKHIAPPWHYYFQCYAYNQLGRYEKAEETGITAVDLMGDCPVCWIIYVNA
jgi:TolB-like protein